MQGSDMTPKPRNNFRFMSASTGRWTAGTTAGHRVLLRLALAGTMATVMPHAVGASPPVASVETGGCTSCTARRQAFQRARQANLQAVCGQGDLTILGAEPCLPADTALHITLPPLPDGSPADAPQSPAGDKKAGKE